MKKIVNINNSQVEIFIHEKNSERVKFEMEGEVFSFSLKTQSQFKSCLEHDKRLYHVPNDGQSFVVNGLGFNVENIIRGRGGRTSTDEKMTSPMPGKILKVLVEIEQMVKKGDPLLIMEAMKMEHTIKASFDGLVTDIFYKENDQVDGGVELVLIIPKDEDGL